MAIGFTERHYAAPASTDSRQRRFSTQFSTQRGSVAELTCCIPCSQLPIGVVDWSAPAASQADSAGSIPVTRSILRIHSSDALFMLLASLPKAPDCGTRARCVPDRRAVRFAPAALSSRRAILSSVEASCCSRSSLVCRSRAELAKLHGMGPKALGSLKTTWLSSKAFASADIPAPNT